VAVGPVTEVDPGALDTPDSILVAAQVFRGLVGHEPATRELVPAAAERWEVLDDGARFLFHLGEETFHDGTPVAAEDFVRAWRRLIDPMRPRPFAFLLEAVRGFSRHRLSFGARPFDGVRALEPGVLEVRLTEPWPDFPALLAHPALAPVPPTVDGAGWGTRPQGNGPYRLAEELRLGSPILLAAVDDGAAVQTVEFRQVDAAETAWPEFLRGELDVAPIPPALVEDARSEFGDRGIRTLPRLVYCGFNMELDFPQELRTAVSVAIDRETIVEDAYGALAEPADGLVAPTLPGYRPGACGPNCERDPERAAALVAEVPSEDRSFQLDVADSEIGRRLAESMAAQLREVGLVPEVRTHGPQRYARLLRRGEVGLFCLVWTADYPRPQGVLEPLLGEGSADNHSGLEDRRLERLLQRGRAEPDPADREEIYVDAERRALRLMPLVPVAWLRSSLAVRPHVEGFVPDMLGLFDVALISLDG
jgi:oligopeptide transport system substrate-binding protein